MPYRLATPQQSPFSVIYFPVAVKTFYAASKILIVFSAKSAMVSDISFAPVAQLDRVSASEAEGRGFESRRAHQFKKILERGFFYWGAGARIRTHERGFGERKRTTPSGGPVRDEERSDEQSRRAHQFKKNPRKRIFLLGRRGAEKNSRAGSLGSYRYPCRPLFVIAKPFRAVAIHLQSANRKCGVNGLRCRFAPRNDDSCYPVQVLALPSTNPRIAAS